MTIAFELPYICVLGRYSTSGRIVNYQYYQAEQICSIGSGAIESTVKQIDRRTKISGAQWKFDNVPQILAHRCAYLNGLIFAH